VACANDVAYWISQRVPGTALFVHPSGCTQLQPDLEMTARTVASVGQNPNLAAVVLVSLGCEAVSADWIEEQIARTGRPVQRVVIQKSGASSALAEGIQTAQRFVMEASTIRKEEFDDSHLVIGVKCGASDTTSGLASNPAVGAAFDLVADRGGTCVFGETTEFLGAEHLLVRRAADQQVAERILAIVDRMEKRVIASVRSSMELFQQQM
jgi:altronate dehydratase large subunit